MNQNILCRVCASTDTELNLVYIYDHYEAEECIADILFELAGIKVPYCFLVDVESGDDDVSIKSSQHEELPKYHCSECAIDFYSTELLQEHYENKHANAIHGWQSFGVNEISLFDTTDDEVEETKKITPEKPVEQSHRCCGCSLVCDTVAELQQHSKTVHAPNAIAPCEDKPFQCEICYHTYTTQRGVIDHQMKMTKLDYQCMYCGIQYGSKFDLRYHEYKHEDHTMSCDICGRQFYKITNLRKHKESMHLAPELRQRHVCNVCGASVKTADYLKLHMQLHSNEDPYRFQ
uniref:C2H2-type domain-containing protein n=1 Tax=Anopheles culicifacies TaxID=139723 RepID=A0A182MX48_9DIPT